jgi:hypothetical protein
MDLTEGVGRGYRKHTASVAKDGWFIFSTIGVGGKVVGPAGVGSTFRPCFFTVTPIFS